MLNQEIEEISADKFDFSIPLEIENKCREELTSYLKSINQADIEKNINELFSLEGSGFVDRANFFMQHIDNSAKECMLVSGGAVGSELIVYKHKGFKTIYGTEVVENYVNIANKRLASLPTAQLDLYDGQNLPYKDEFFSMITSGHIIEHTPNPYEYFKEHMRVLHKGGFFFLEFPNRYHYKELHTGQVSFEWLPLPIRNFVLRVLASKYSPLSEHRRGLFNAVRYLLMPISIWQIKYFLLKSGNLGSKIVATQKPAPGFVRVLIKK